MNQGKIDGFKGFQVFLRRVIEHIAAVVNLHDGFGGTGNIAPDQILFQFPDVFLHRQTRQIGELSPRQLALEHFGNEIIFFMHASSCGRNLSRSSMFNTQTVKK